MISGRGLGHTGGTLDKLEVDPRLHQTAGRGAFRKRCSEAGCAIIGQTADLGARRPQLYAIRDVTATVESRAADHRLDPVEEARRRPRGAGARRQGSATAPS